MLRAVQQVKKKKVHSLTDPIQHDSLPLSDVNLKPVLTVYFSEQDKTHKSIVTHRRFSKEHSFMISVEGNQTYYLITKIFYFQKEWKKKKSFSNKR